MVELTNLTIDLLCIGNVMLPHPSSPLIQASRLTIHQDLVSYNKEQASEDDEHNIITIVMANHNTTLDNALIWVADFHAKLEVRFNDVYRNLPRWGGALDDDVQIYVFGLANWVRANDQWSFESQRYFGKRGLEIMESRTVTLLPKVQGGTADRDVGPVVVDGRLL
jgi:hypothetical protein